MSSFKGQKILITGAARGIGAELARQLAREGAHLALIGLEPELLEKLARELGVHHTWSECDVTNYGQVEEVIQKCALSLGGLDVVIANAGIASVGTVAVTPVEVLTKTVEVNLLGAIHTAHASMPAILASQGYLLFVASSTSILSVPGTAAYAASKAGVEHFASILRFEVAHRGVDVGCAFPSWVDTDMVRDQCDGTPLFKDIIESLPWPFDRINTVEDCAAGFVRAIRRRSSKVYIPKALWFGSILSALYKNPFGYTMAKFYARSIIPLVEEDLVKTGAFFGSNSMGRKLLKSKSVPSDK